MMRNDINIAIVSMVRAPKSLNQTANETVTTAFGTDGEFEWSSNVRAMILGSFYAWYVISQVSPKLFRSIVKEQRKQQHQNIISR